jgi:hypothetical protein
MLLLYPGELYRLLGASSFLSVGDFTIVELSPFNLSAVFISPKPKQMILT